jgi:hypothetical protein
VQLAYPIFRELVVYYAIRCLADYIRLNEPANLQDLQAALPENRMPETWVNAGGQLIRKSALNDLIRDIHSNRIKSWQDVHQFYRSAAATYTQDKLYHALDILKGVHDVSIKTITPGNFKELLEQSVAIAGQLTQNILLSREKDYENPFRKMVYENQAEMDQVIGKPEENPFIKSRFEAFQEYKSATETLISKWNL